LQRSDRIAGILIGGNRVAELIHVRPEFALFRTGRGDGRQPRALGAAECRSLLVRGRPRCARLWVAAEGEIHRRREGQCAARHGTIEADRIGEAGGTLMQRRGCSVRIERHVRGHGNIRHDQRKCCRRPGTRSQPSPATIML
jgi:hypothetical protein